MGTIRCHSALTAAAQCDCILPLVDMAALLVIYDGISAVGSLSMNKLCQ